MGRIQQYRVLGGVVCIWGGYSNIITRVLGGVVCKWGRIQQYNYNRVLGGVVCIWEHSY